jgi:phospholipid-binding lipoprotein MlaA
VTLVRCFSLPLRILSLFTLLAAGCATTGEGDPRDPLEPMNRAVYRFNEVADEYVAIPVASAYRTVLHAEIRDRVRNFFANLADPWIGINNVLQGKFYEAFEDGMRFIFNSTFGLFGLHDVASDMGIEKHDEDFGQTLGWWGVPDGPYIVLPILSSSSVRDTAGWGVDVFTGDPVGYARPIALRNSMYALRLVNRRSELLDASRILEQAALDKYVFQRDAYLQRRRNLVYDGRPPREPREPDEPPEKEPAKEPAKQPAKEPPK